MAQSLTLKQQVVFDFIEKYVEKHECAPFIREIQLGCQIASYKSAVDRLNALERKGYIKRLPNKHRAIKIMRHPSMQEKPAVQIAEQTVSGESLGS